jgi:hypothetical protein
MSRTARSIVIVPRYGKQFDSRNELSWATDALPRLLPSARLLMVQYDFKMLPENPVDSLVTSFLDLLDGERQAAVRAS